MHISLPRGIFKEVSYFSNKNGVHSIGYFSVGYTVGSEFHDPKYIVIIYNCPGNIQVFIQTARQMRGNKLIHTHIGLVFFNILFVSLTSNMLLCVCGCLVQFFCLGTLRIRCTLTYVNYHLSNDIFTVILVHLCT